MRVIMLSWEYPPKIVGGISRHLYDLAQALVAQGIEVHVVTCEHPGAATEAFEDGVYVYRVGPSGSGDNFIHWVHLLNDAMYNRASPLIDSINEKSARSGGPPEPIIIHAHDWLAHFAATRLKHTFKIPMVATIHATEFGRNSGINGPTQTYINSIEWELQFEAWRVIVCTDFMRRECEHALRTPWEKMDVIFNGVDADKFQLPDFTDDERTEFRAKYAAPNEKIIFFVGRMVREKGVQVLIEALPYIRFAYHDAKLLIVGGGQKQHLINQAVWLGMEPHIYFAGFVPDEDLLKIYQIIDVACFPSLYEPFGIVALEAMAAHVPVVVSDAGGLPEVVENRITGLTTFAGNAGSLTDGILEVLRHEDFAKQLASRAFERVETTFNWSLIAGQTIAVYQRVWDEYLESDWGKSLASIDIPVHPSGAPPTAKMKKSAAS